MELFDLYDAARRPTGETIVRGTPVPEGRYRLVIHVCIFNSKGEMLIQQRQSFKSGWPNLWDLTLGGCVTMGESSQQAARRELSEELGLDADFSHTAPAFSVTFHGGFDDYYLLQRDVEVSSLRLQYEEVQGAKWATQEEVFAMLDSGEFIPYKRAFLEFLFRGIVPMKWEQGSIYQEK